MKNLYKNHPFLAGILSMFSGLAVALILVLVSGALQSDAFPAFVNGVCLIAIPAGLVLAAICFIRVIRLEPKNTPGSVMKTGFCGMIVAMAPIYALVCISSLIQLIF